MKKVGIFVSVVLLSLAPKVNAESSVNITSEGNASAKVNVTNEFNSTNNSTNTNTSHTSVRIETDGEVKEYESNSGEDVIMESSDGSSKVTIKNGGSTNITVGPVEDRDEKSIKTADEVKKEIDGAEKKQENLFEKIKDAIVDFLKNLF